MQKRYDIDYSMAVETPHVKWAKPFNGGKIKTFFVPNIGFGREVIEMAQRFDIDYETVTIDRNWDTNKWGLGDFYDKRASQGDFSILYDNLQNALCSDEVFDVLVIPGINGWGFLPEAIKKAIRKRVEDGAGLIIHRPLHGIDLPKDETLSDLSPLLPDFEEEFTFDGYAKPNYGVLTNQAWKPCGHYITHGIPFEAFDCMRLGIYPYHLAEGAVSVIDAGSGAPIAAVKACGKGRVVAFGYIPTFILPDIYDKDLPLENGCFGSVTLAASYPDKNVRFNENEYFYAMLGRAVIWAAQKEPAPRIDGIRTNGAEVTIESAHADIAYCVKNIYDQEILTGRGKAFSLPASAMLGGIYRIEAFAMESDKTADYHIAMLDIPKTAWVDSLTIKGGEYITPGSEFVCEAAFAGANADITFGIYDDFENLLQTETIAVNGAGVYTIRYRAAPQRALNLRAVAEVHVGCLVIDKKESRRVIVSPAMRTIDDFEALLSPTYRGRPDFLLFTGELFRQIGITGLYPGDSRMVMPSGAEGLGVYWYKRAGYVKRKEQYLATKDKKYLWRTPCLSDPVFWQENTGKIEAQVGKSKKFGPLSYFANDEGSLTCYSDENEYCFCPHCMKDMQAWLQTEYASLADLNRAWGKAFAAWVDVIPDTFAEAEAEGSFAAWGAHRLFMETVFTGAYEKIIGMVRAQDPEARIRMSGCQVSSPYTGCDYYLLHKHVGYFEAYTGGNQIEFHRSFMRPGTIIGGWTGYGVSGIDARQQIWERVLHGFTLQSVFWNVSNVNPDFTFPKTATDLSLVFKEIRREGIGKLLLHTNKRDHLGIAVHYSMPSVHGSYAINQEQKFTNNREGWVNLLEGCGYQYNFLAAQQIEEGGLDAYSVLILPFSIAVSDAEAAAIKTFVANGGFVIGDFATGMMDKHCAWREGGCLDDVFGIVRGDRLLRPFYTDQELMRSKSFDAFAIPEALDGAEFAQSGVRLQEGVSAGYLQDFSGTVPAVAAHAYGKGRSVYLNISLHNYPDMNKNGEGQGIRDLFTSIMDYAGVEKFAAIYDAQSKPAQAGIETVYYSRGDARYVAILRYYFSRRRMGHDGLAVGGTEDENGHKLPVTLRLPRKAHLYDVREKTYIGYQDAVQTTLEEGNVRLISVLPEAVRSVEAVLPDEVKQGDAFSLQINIDKGGAAYTSVVAVNFTTPSGKYGFLYSQNIAVEGCTARADFQFPLNEELGVWTVSVKDVASGIEVVKRVWCKQ